METNPIRHSKKLHTTTARVSRRELLQSVFWLVLIFALIYGFARFVGFENLRATVERAGIFGPALLAFLKASTLVFAPLGGAPLYPVSGALFGFWKGFLIMFIGDFIGTTVSFYISRRFGRKIAGYFLSQPGMRVVNDILSHLGTIKGLIQARVILVGFPEGVSYAAGLTTLPYRKFIPVHMGIGIVPVALVVGFGDVIVKQASSLVITLGGFGVLFFMMAGGWWFYRQAQRRGFSEK